MPTIEENVEAWGKTHDWSKDGDEWDDQATFCHQPYPDWKESLVDTFIRPNLTPASTVLELAPGHGRWTACIVDRAARAILVDLNSACIEHCRRRFAGYDNVEYVVNDGRTLGSVGDESVDFIWSYDSFVHMEPDVIRSYFLEFARVLKPGGRAIIHHAARHDLALRFHFLRRLGGPGRSLYDLLSWGNTRGNPGWRSQVSRGLVRQLAAGSRLAVESQVDSWGADGRCTCRLFQDAISTLHKSPAPVDAAT